jgi:hypothetical protein
MTRILAHLFVALGLILLSPFILAIALLDWWHVWRKGYALNPFLPEMKISPEDWAAAMERARQIQAMEERRD